MNEILVTTKATLTQYLMHWHRLSVDAALFLGTASITVATIAISRDNANIERSTIFFCLLLLISAVGTYLNSIMVKQVVLLRSIIQKIDEEQGLFDPGLLKTGDSIYPIEWRVPTSAWRDPIFRLTRFAVSFMPIVLAALVAWNALTTK